VIGFFLVRGSPPPSPRADKVLGKDIPFDYVESPGGLGSLHWKVELGPLEHLELSFYASRDGARQELLFEPQILRTNEWTPTPEQARALTADWIEELVLVDSSGDSHLLKRLPHSSSQ